MNVSEPDPIAGADPHGPHPGTADEADGRTSTPYEPETVHELVDWRAINKHQHETGIRALYGEDGEPLAGFAEIKLTAQHTLEDPAEEILPAWIAGDGTIRGRLDSPGTENLMNVSEPDPIAGADPHGPHPGTADEADGRTSTPYEPETVHELMRAWAAHSSSDG